MSHTLVFGRTRFQVSALKLPSPLQDGAYTKLSFSFQWADGFNGAAGLIEVLHGSAVVATARLNRYGPTRFSFTLRNLEPSHELVFDLQIKDVSKTHGVNSEAGLEGVGRIDLADMQLIDEPIGARTELAIAARDIAERLGLRGNYMKGERRERFEARILEAIRKKTPYCVIRLGDGEGRLLGVGETFTPTEVLTQVLYYHFGAPSINPRRDRDRNWALSISLELKDMLMEAMRSSDEIGMPVWDFFRALDEQPTSGMLGYAPAMFTALALDPYREAIDRVGTNVFQQLAQTRDFFQAVSSEADKLLLIGPWDLTAELSGALNPKAIDYVEVPRHHTWGDVEGFGQYPFLYTAVEQRIRAMGDLSGVVVLIGAGIFGKHYARLAKEQGAVALDIGSVFDSWHGKGLPYAVRNPRLGIDKLK
jgi:hypothetical protein